VYEISLGRLTNPSHRPAFCDYLRKPAKLLGGGFFLGV
jgi:hypothetical protein